MPLKRPPGPRIAVMNCRGIMPITPTAKIPKRIPHHILTTISKAPWANAASLLSERESRRRRCRRQAITTAQRQNQKSQSTLRREEQQGEGSGGSGVGSEQQDDIVGKVRRSGERRGELAEGLSLIHI